MVNKRLRDGLIILGIAAWFGAAGAGILLTRERPGVFTEMLAYSLVAPVLVASFFYGRGAGLLAALLASLLSGSLAVGQPEVLDSPIVQRVLFQIIAFNVVALMIGSLAQREREERAQLETIQDTALVGYALIEADTHSIVNVNRYAAEMIGLPREQIIGRECFEFLCPDCKRECPITELKRSLVDAEQTLIRADGAAIPIHKTVTPITLGGQAYLIETFLDISERVRQERELARHAESMAILSEASQHLQTTLELEHVYAAAHDAVQKLMPCDSFVIALLDETGREIEDAYFWDENKRWPHQPYPSGQGLIGFVISSGKPLRVNEWGAEHDRLTGATLFGNTGRDTQSVLAAPLFDQNGKCFGVISAQAYAPNAYTIGQEHLLVTLASQVSKAIENARLVARLNHELEERRRAEREAQESAKRYQALFTMLRLMADTMPDLLWAKDLQGRYIFANRAICEKLLNASNTDEPLGKTDLFFAERERQSHPDDPHWHTFGEICVNSDAVVLENEQAQRFDEFGNVKGEFLFLDVHKAPLYDERGNLIGTVGSGRIVTEEKAAQAKIQRQNQRLTTLREIDTAILAADSVEDIVGAALSHTRELIGCRRASLALVDWEEKEALMFDERAEGETTFPKGLRVPLAMFQDMLETVLQDQLALINDLSALENPPPLIQAAIQEGLRSVCVLPLFSQSNLIGSFNMASEIPSFFDEEKINIGREVANQVAIAITQSRLFESLRASEEKYSILFDKSPFAIALSKAPENTIVGVNDAFLELFGFTRAEVIGKTSLELGVADEESRTKIMAEFQARGRLHDFEAARITKTGRRLDLSLNWDWVTIGGEKYILNTIRDITEQKLRARERETLLALATALRAASNRAEMLPIILDQIISLMKLDGAALASLDSASGEVIVELARGSLEGWGNVRIPPGQGITGIVMASGETYVTNDLASDPNIYRPDLASGIISVACAPLTADKKAIGALWIQSAAPMQDADVRLLEGIADMAATALQRATLFEQTVQYASQLSDAYEKNIEGWSRALDLRDKETEGHTQRVTTLTLELARAMGIPEADIVHIRRGALLHDIGKMGVPDHILLKPGALTAEEMETMRQHPVFAYELLKPIEFLRDALDIPYFHHEKWDGTGYPHGLKGEQIPLAARLFAVVDVWDALTSDRSYRKAWSREKTLEYLRKQSGKHFDPQVVEAFLQVLDQAG